MSAFESDADVLLRAMREVWREIGGTPEEATGSFSESVISRYRALEAELTTLRQNNMEMTTLFDMQFRRDVEFVQRLRAEGKTPPLVHPDYGSMLTMAVMALEKAEQERDALVLWRDGICDGSTPSEHSIVHGLPAHRRDDGVFEVCLRALWLANDQTPAH